MRLRDAQRRAKTRRLGRRATEQARVGCDRELARPCSCLPLFSLPNLPTHHQRLDPSTLLTTRVANTTRAEVAYLPAERALRGSVARASAAACAVSRARALTRATHTKRPSAYVEPCSRPKRAAALFLILAARSRANVLLLSRSRPSHASQTDT